MIVKNNCNCDRGNKTKNCVVKLSLVYNNFYSNIQIIIRKLLPLRARLNAHVLN